MFDSVVPDSRDPTRTKRTRIKISILISRHFRRKFLTDFFVRIWKVGPSTAWQGSLRAICECANWKSDIHWRAGPNRLGTALVFPTTIKNVLFQTTCFSNFSQSLILHLLGPWNNIKYFNKYKTQESTSRRKKNSSGKIAMRVLFFVFVTVIVSVDSRFN